MKKLPFEIFFKIAQERGGECLTKREDYINSSTKVLWKCGDGHEWYAMPRDVKNKNSWCPFCSNKRINNPLELCNKIALERGGRCLSDKYINNTIKIKWQCQYEHIWEAQFYDIKNGQWCPQCYGRIKLTLEHCQESVKKYGGLCLSDKYINNRVKMEWQCEKGHQWWSTLDSITQGKWCPYCAGIKIEDPLGLCKKIAEQHAGKFLSTEYKNNREKLLWQCQYKHIWEAPLHYIKDQDGWCPKCSNLISKQQKEIYDQLTACYPKLEIILNDVNIIKPLHLDIYIPRLKIGIEYDGEYWHYSDWAIESGSLKIMKRKNYRCKKMNIKLIRIREKKWKRQKDKILAKLIQQIEKFLQEAVNEKI